MGHGGTVADKAGGVGAGPTGIRIIGHAEGFELDPRGSWKPLRVESRAETGLNLTCWELLGL